MKKTDSRQAQFFRVTERPGALTLEMASHRALLSRATAVCRAYLARSGLGACPHAALVIRELLSNAMTHGNQNRSEERVACEIAPMGGRGIRIWVKDNGRGFAHAALNLSLPEDPRRIRRRGLILVNAVAESVQFNACGNEVNAWLRV